MGGWRRKEEEGGGWWPLIRVTAIPPHVLPPSGRSIRTVGMSIMRTFPVRFSCQTATPQIALVSVNYKRIRGQIFFFSTLYVTPRPRGSPFRFANSRSLRDLVMRKKVSKFRKNSLDNSRSRRDAIRALHRLLGETISGSSNGHA